MSSAARTRRRRAARGVLRCPDCHSTSRVGAARGVPGVDLLVEVAHDPSCPWLAQNGGAKGRFTILRLVDVAARGDDA